MIASAIPSPLCEPQLQALGRVATLYSPPALPAALIGGSVLRFGLIADPQYADAEPDLVNNLYYRHGVRKLGIAIDKLNALPLDFVVTLGDLVDRDWSSYTTLLPCYDVLRHPHAAVIGNHDAAVISRQLAAQPVPLPLPKSYYQFSLPGWRFLVIDGNDVSLYCNAANGNDRQRAQAQLDALIDAGQPQAQPWNGAVGSDQLIWIEQQLQLAKQNGETTLVFGHYPLAPVQKHMLWNGTAIASLLCRYQVRAYFAGHDHRGGYTRLENTDFITLKGMLDGADNVPFAVVELTGEVMKISGYDREISRLLPLDCRISVAG